MLRKLKQIDQSFAGDGQSPTWTESIGIWEAQGWFESSNDDLGLQSTTSNIYQERFKHTTSVNTPDGKYLLSWHFAWASSSVARDCGYRVQVDDTTDIVEYEIEAIESSSTHQPSKSGKRIITLTEGSHDIDIDYRAVPGGGPHTVFCGTPRITLRWISK